MPRTNRTQQPVCRHLCLALLLAGACAGPAFAQSVNGADDPDITLLDRVVVTATPLPGTQVDADELPYTVQTATAQDIARAQANNLTDFAVRRLNGVNSNEVQGSPFQTDITYHGFRASALPGASQGISVYLDGVRVNEPFADIVSWDMVPEAAIRSLALMPGSNPLYGPNTLGGALAFTTKSGATDPGLEADISFGSNDRKRMDASFGWAGANGFNGLVAATVFDEDGWRDLSEGNLGSVFAKFGQDGDVNDWSLSLLYGRSRLIGNGLLPSWRYTDEGREPGLYEMDRRAIFTAPDLTRNRNAMATFQFDHAFSDSSNLHLLAYHRQGRRDTVNGDVSEEYEDYVEDCGDGFDENGEPLGDDCDVTAAEGAQIPTGVFNTTSMRQWADGIGANMAQQVGAHQLAYGLTYDWNRVEYAQYEQAGDIDASRSIGAIPGSEREFFSGVRGRSHTLGAYVGDLWQLGENTWLDLSLRWNRVQVANTLSTDDDGDLPRERFTYTKANPSLGITRKFGDGFAFHANASQNSRAPTAIELGCADPETPCRLPTGLQADPKLKQIVSRTLDAGLRWNPSQRQSFDITLYRADNRNDILFLRAPDTQQGYFDNVDRTRYQGADIQYTLQTDAFDLYAGYSFLDATYQAHGELLSGERIIELKPGMRIAALPRNTFKLGVDWHVTPAFSLGADFQAVSRRGGAGNEDGLVGNPGGDDDDDDGGEDADDIAAMPADDDAVDVSALRHDISTAGYALFNLRAQWTLNQHLSLYARVNNVFDRRYETYSAIADDLFPGGELARPQVAPVEDGPSRFVAPGAPRQFVVGLRMKF